MYALNLDPETGRVLSATFPKFAPSDAPQVETLPEGDISDWLYDRETGAYTYLPLPAEPAAPGVDEMTLLQAQVQALSDRNEFLEDCIAEMAEIIYA